MTVPAIIRRSFAIADDATVGGTTLAKLEESAGATAATLGQFTPQAAAVTPFTSPLYWAVTGGTLDPGLERIDRKAEVRGRRAISPMLPFRAAPVVTVPFPAYRVLIDKLMRKTLGGEDQAGGAIPGSAGAGYTHSFLPIGFGTSAVSRLPAFSAQLVRDDLNHMLAGCVSNKISLAFSLDGEATGELEAHALYYGDSQQPTSAATFTEQENVLALRDAQVFFDGTGGALTAPAKPTLTFETTGGTLAAATYNYQVVAYNSNGQTVGSGEATAAVTTTGATSKVIVKWAEVSGALGYRVYGRTSGVATQLLLADVGNQLSFVDNGAITPVGAGFRVPTVNTTGGAVPDMIGFDFSYVNNVLTKWYAGRNVGLVSSGAGALKRTARLWFPTEFKIGGEEDITYGLQFGNTNTAQEFNREYSTIQKIVFNVVGAEIPGTSPTVYEEIKITIYNAQPGTGGGPDALAARGDTTYRIDGNGFYSTAESKDVQYESINGTSTAIV